MLYTRKGDGGTSGLFGTTERFPKEGPVYDALGALDELVSLLGVCRARASREKGSIDVAGTIRNAQECLFMAQAELAGAPKSVLPLHLHELENVIGKIETLFEAPHAFVIPGATEPSALFDYARAVARRTERRVLAAAGTREVSASTRAYLNRLSSLLYALARYVAMVQGAKETPPSYGQ